MRERHPVVQAWWLWVRGAAEVRVGEEEAVWLVGQLAPYLHRSRDPETGLRLRSVAQALSTGFKGDTWLDDVEEAYVRVRRGAPDVTGVYGGLLRELGASLLCHDVPTDVYRHTCLSLGWLVLLSDLLGVLGENQT